MTARRVFIVWRHPLFFETVRLVVRHSGVEVVGASSEYASAQGAIDELRPDVVIVEEAEDEPVSQAEAVRILEASPWGLRIIRLSLDDNDLWVYQRERKRLGQSDDLLHLILTHSGESPEVGGKHPTAPQGE